MTFLSELRRRYGSDINFTIGFDVNYCFLTKNSNLCLTFFTTYNFSLIYCLCLKFAIGWVRFLKILYCPRRIGSNTDSRKKFGSATLDFNFQHFLDYPCYSVNVKTMHFIEVRKVFVSFTSYVCLLLCWVAVVVCCCSSSITRREKLQFEIHSHFLRQQLPNKHLNIQ